MNEYEVLFQCEEDAVITDPQAVFAGLASQFKHVAVQAVLERIKPLADPAALLPGQRAQLLQCLVTDIQPVVHAASQARAAASGKCVLNWPEAFGGGFAATRWGQRVPPSTP